MFRIEQDYQPQKRHQVKLMEGLFRPKPESMIYSSVINIFVPLKVDITQLEIYHESPKA